MIESELVLRLEMVPIIQSLVGDVKVFVFNLKCSENPLRV